MSVVRPFSIAESVFPDSDGPLRAKNTRQYEAMVTLKGNLAASAFALAVVTGDPCLNGELVAPCPRPAAASRWGAGGGPSRRGGILCPGNLRT